MKKTFICVAMLSIAFLAPSCKSSSSPSAIAEKFSKAMLNDDYATAEKLSTVESAKILQENEQMSKENPLPDSIKALIKVATVKIINEKIENDTTASVVLKTVLPKEIMGKKENDETLSLKKENGQWRIDIFGTMKKMMQEEGGGMQMQADDMSSDSLEEPNPDSLGK